MNLNINELEAQMVAYAETVALGGPNNWEKETYEWLGQSLTIESDDDGEFNTFTITLILAGEEKVDYVTGPFDFQAGWLHVILHKLAMDCRWAIEEQAAGEVKASIRNAIGIHIG